MSSDMLAGVSDNYASLLPSLPVPENLNTSFPATESCHASRRKRFRPTGDTESLMPKSCNQFCYAPPRAPAQEVHGTGPLNQFVLRSEIPANRTRRSQASTSRWLRKRTCGIRGISSRYCSRYVRCVLRPYQIIELRLANRLRSVSQLPLHTGCRVKDLRTPRHSTRLTVTAIGRSSQT